MVIIVNIVNRILEFVVKFVVFILMVKFAYIIPNFWILASLILLILL